MYFVGIAAMMVVIHYLVFCLIIALVAEDLDKSDDILMLTVPPQPQEEKVSGDEILFFNCIQ